MEGPGTTILCASGPEGVRGTIRLSRAGRTVLDSFARSLNGERVEIDVMLEANTVLVRYPMRPEGLEIKLRWSGSGPRP
ncbi:MAG: hypothetical protein C4321_08195, partial [Chloroflexota bacterium]